MISQFRDLAQDRASFGEDRASVGGIVRQERAAVGRIGRQLGRIRRFWERGVAGHQAMVPKAPLPDEASQPPSAMEAPVSRHLSVDFKSWDRTSGPSFFILKVHFPEDSGKFSNPL